MVCLWRHFSASSKYKLQPRNIIESWASFRRAPLFDVKTCVCAFSVFLMVPCVLFCLACTCYILIFFFHFLHSSPHFFFRSFFLSFSLSIIFFVPFSPSIRIVLCLYVKHQWLFFLHLFRERKQISAISMLIFLRWTPHFRRFLRYLFRLTAFVLLY